MTTASDELFLDLLAARLGGTITPTRPDQKTWPTPGALAVDVDRRTVQTPALDKIDEALTWVTSGPDRRLILNMAPQEGKSDRIQKFIAWSLSRNNEARIVMASNGLDLARRNGRAVRDLVINNSGLLGLRIRPDVAAQTEWQLLGHTGGLYSVGIGGSLTGRPADMLVIDDPVKDRVQADSEIWRQRVWDWWTDVGSARLAPGAPVVLILTRWHEDDLAGRLLKSEDAGSWRVLNIPAQADHDPSKGETDVLGREPGEFMVSARGRTREQWEQRKRTAGARSWASLYQGRPSPAGGGYFKRDKWRYYSQPLWLDRGDGSRFLSGYDDLIASWDMAFKDLESSDYVVGQVWMRRGAEAFLLDQVRGRWDFPETCRQLIAFTARWPQALLKLVEDKANGTAVIAALRRTVPGIVPEEPQGSKVARASAVSPVQEAMQLYLPDPMLGFDEVTGVAPFAWVPDFVEEAATFPAAAHDDQVDGMTQALNRLYLQPFVDEDTVGGEDLDDELAGFGSFVVG